MHGKRCFMLYRAWIIMFGRAQAIIIQNADISAFGFNFCSLVLCMLLIWCWNGWIKNRVMEKWWSLNSWKLTLSLTVSEHASIIQTSLTMCLRCSFLIKTLVARIYPSHNYYRGVCLSGIIIMFLYLLPDLNNVNDPSNHHTKFEIFLICCWFYKNPLSEQCSHRGLYSR